MSLQTYGMTWERFRGKIGKISKTKVDIRLAVMTSHNTQLVAWVANYVET
jgi:hypothetical protein